MKVIGIVGMPGSGKGEFSAIAEEAGIPVVVMGDVIRGEVTRQGLPPTDESMGIVARHLRSLHGLAAIAHVCIPVIDAQKKDIVLIDGIRGDTEVREFMEHFSDFVLISVEAPLSTRFERLSSRGRTDDLQNIEDLVARDERECSFGLGNAIGMATVRLNNTGTRDEFRKTVTDLLRSYGAAL